jgi:nucleoside 2-deoxyribosyltransferase
MAAGASLFKLAAPLFTEAERLFNVAVASRLRDESHEVYLPQCETPAIEGAGRTTTIFRANLAALATADAIVAICDGPQVDDGTAWEIGYAYGRTIPVYALRTDTRVVHQADERINLMILESLNELSPAVEQLIHTLRYAENR